MNRLKDTYKHMAAVASALLLALSVLPACSDDEGGGADIPEAQYAKLVISLGSLDNATPAATKAVDDDGYIESDIIDDEYNDSDYEHYIDKWWLLVLHQEDGAYQFDRLISNSPTANNTHPDSETSIEMELLIYDTYKFYAFANLGGLDNGEDVIKWIEGLNAASFEEAEFQKEGVELLDMNSYHEGEGSSYIPMSSYGYTVTVQADNNSLRIPLIRLLGKVELDVTNSSGKDVKIEKLTMGKFRDEGEIYLLPYDVATGDNGTGNLMVGTGDEKKLLNPSFPTESERVGNDWTLPETADKELFASAENDANKRTYTFYINETGNQNQEGGGAKDMTIAMKVSGIEKDETEQDTRFFFIRRNDWLRIPILISNAQTTITVAQRHMPIGGVPAELFFDNGAIIADQTVTLDHAGIVTIGYALKEINGQTNGWSLKYLQSTYQPGEQFCMAQVEDNPNGLILVRDDDKDDESQKNIWIDLDWLDDSQKGFNLQPTEGSKTSGSFKLRIQELASGTAKVKLTLVATHTSGQEIILPYTITLNYEGGN
ncbi:MAG TPA: hypothetical protein H9848_04775 [Candidatus Parabacteroides intestinigallinarum]|uniref:Major fimbrial subunit protein N-terminal domain-containing protein n=1 Tax=Candidatus Parabacteroides intestinigallinarum TaxID=2838722 RepID=A0A9D1XQL3_9BACT|nr:hypothetical protein [Candidatus Parabacteroides intestinigallinarum]